MPKEKEVKEEKEDIKTETLKVPTNPNERAEAQPKKKDKYS